MARKDFLKAVNRSTILRVIKAYGPIARTNIARITSLSSAAVTGLTAELIQDGLIYEKEEGDSSGGRKPILLALDASGAYVVGIKLSEESCILALTDLNGVVVDRLFFTMRNHDANDVSDQIAEGVQKLLRASAVDRSRLLGVGIGLPGIINANEGICRMSPSRDWVNVPLAKMVKSRLKYPVYLDNDVNTLTLVEQLYGVGQHISNFLVATIGRGIGLGIIANNQLYRGAGGGSGELGHTVVDANGLLCSCGKRGCLETLVAEPWLVRHAKLNGLEISTPTELVKAAEASHLVAIEILERAGTVFGQSLANVINLFNPSLLIISGEGIRAGDYFFKPMYKAIEQFTFGLLGKDVEVRIDPLTDESWARGAASLVLNSVFDNPSIQEGLAQHLHELNY